MLQCGALLSLLYYVHFLPRQTKQLARNNISLICCWVVCERKRNSINNGCPAKFRWWTWMLSLMCGTSLVHQKLNVLVRSLVASCISDVIEKLMCICSSYVVKNVHHYITARRHVVDRYWVATVVLNFVQYTGGLQCTFVCSDLDVHIMSSLFYIPCGERWCLW